MTEAKEQPGVETREGVKRRGLLKFGTLITAATGISALSSLEATEASATTDPNGYVSAAEMQKAIADLLTPATRPAEITPEVIGGRLYMTEAATGIRIKATGAGQTIAGTPYAIGGGVAATINGADKWVSKTGVIRPAATNFAKGILAGSSSAQNLAPELAAEVAKRGMLLHSSTSAVGSYQMSHIAAAIGIRPLVANSFAIPVSGGVTVVPTNLPESNNTAIPAYWHGEFEGTGIPGVISTGAGSPTWTFTRTSAGPTHYVSAGAPFIPSKSYENQEGVAFLNLAKNSFTDIMAGLSYKTCLDLTQKAYDFYSGAGRHVLVLGHFQTSVWYAGSSGHTHIANYNAWCAEQYGARFVDIQSYLSSTQIWADTGIAPTNADLQAQIDQHIPPSLRSDEQHLNNTADAAVAALIGNRMDALGWGAQPGHDLSPTIPKPLAQWNANGLSTGTVNSWPSMDGTASLLASNGAQAPVAVREGANSFLRFRPTDDDMQWAAFKSFGTVAFVLRISGGTGTTVLTTGGGIVQRSGSGNWATNSGTWLTTPMATDIFHVAGATMNGDSSVVSLDQAVNSGPSGLGPKIMFKIGNNDDAAGTLDIAALLVWSEHLTAAQLKTVDNDLSAIYTSLLP